MKRPKCMEKRILDDVPVKHLCPKCGSELRAVVEHDTGYWCPVCDGHEEKVGGEKG